MKLTTEEQKLIEQHRAQEAAKKEELRKCADLEKQFLHELELAHSEIAQHLKDAEKSLEKAVAISEERGIPFDSYICRGNFRHYHPRSFSTKYGKLSNDFKYDHSLDNYESGWDGWNGSNC